MKPIALPVLLLFAFVVTPGQDWKRSEKKDDIETSYRSEKIASDQFDVGIQVHNKRTKPVRVVVRPKYNRPRVAVGLPPPVRDIVLARTKFNDECTVVVAPNSTGTCSVTISTTKVTGSKIVRWENVNPGLRIISVKPNP
jgi:hypothetical protein